MGVYDGVMFQILVCAVVFAAGLVAAGRWGGDEFEPSVFAEQPGAGSAGWAARRYLWYATVGMAAGLAGGLVAATGGRLIMRLLAATSSAAAQGRITEADEVVGRITTEGTVGLVVFVALFSAALTGPTFMLVRHWLPRRWLAGLSFGALALSMLATRVEPLRPSNRDFDIVGPDWLAVLTYSLLFLVSGLTLSAVANRYARVLPPLSRRPQVLARYAPLLIAVPLIPVLGFIMAGIAVAIALSRKPFSQVGTWLTSPRALLAGRIVLLTVFTVTLPGTVMGIADILQA